MSGEYLLLQTLNGISLAGLLFFLASGLTLIFGLMRVVNLAHGSGNRAAASCFSASGQR